VRELAVELASRPISIAAVGTVDGSEFDTLEFGNSTPAPTAVG
jgi:hypothetical protein